MVEVKSDDGTNDLCPRDIKVEVADANTLMPH